MEGRIEELEAEVRNLQAQVGHAGLCDASSRSWHANLAGITMQLRGVISGKPVLLRCRQNLAPSTPSKRARYIHSPSPSGIR